MGQGLERTPVKVRCPHCKEIGFGIIKVEDGKPVVEYDCDDHLHLGWLPGCGQVKQKQGKETRQ